jgi:hypothetical protein
MAWALPPEGGRFANDPFLIKSDLRVHFLRDQQQRPAVQRFDFVLSSSPGQPWPRIHFANSAIVSRQLCA